MVSFEKHPQLRGADRLTSELELCASREVVFEFFSDAFQLEKITPPWLHFSVQTPRPIEMRTGTLIDYRLRLHGIPIRWRTRIALWEPPDRFIDEQIMGPYRLWRHLHTFESREGRTVCRDQVDYAVPARAFVHSWLVKRDLRQIFEFRRAKLTSILEASSSRSAPSVSYRPG